MRNPLKLLARASFDPERVDTVAEKLRTAGPTTLSDCNEILAVVIVHAQKDHTGVSATDLAAEFVRQYKKPGWIPEALSVDAHTPATMEQVSDIARRERSAVNRLLAEHLMRLVPDVDTDRARAIGFSGTNTATGDTFFAVLAR